jgi:hypothetical protein
VSGIRGCITAALLAVSAAFGLAAQTGPAPVSSCALTAPDRIVAIGDVHGAFDKFVAILREAHLIDGDRRWSGGRTTLVQTGDILDRGPDSKRAVDLIRSLEIEAARAGGQVIALNGNHEIMRMTGDLRYVSDKEYAAFQNPDSRELRDKLYTAASDNARKQARAANEKFDEGAFRKAFYEETPLGLVEMHRAFSETGEYGRVLRSRGVIARIGGVVFVHGGISPPIAEAGCAAIDARARLELRALGTDPAVEPALLSRPDGPLWFRGLVDGTMTEADVSPLLEKLGARAIVVGHTVLPDNRITAFFGGKVIAIDTGMLDGEFFPNGVPSALEIKGGVGTAIYIGKREPVGSIGK